MTGSEERAPRYISKIEMEALNDDGEWFALMTIHDDRGEEIEYAFQEAGARALIASIENWLQAISGH